MLLLLKIFFGSILFHSQLKVAFNELIQFETNFYNVTDLRIHLFFPVKSNVYIRKSQRDSNFDEWKKLFVNNYYRYKVRHTRFDYYLCKNNDIKIPATHLK